MSRRATIIVMLGASALVVAPALSGHGARLVWNASASAPVGLYAAVPAGRFEVGDLVATAPPDTIADFLDARGYLPRGIPLIKRVLALPGTTVCRHGATITAHGRTYGEARERDALGRPLPIWEGCRTLRSGEVFLMNWDAPDSFDGRYFGPLPAASVVARLTPVWTDGDGDGRFRWRAAGPASAP